MAVLCVLVRGFFVEEEKDVLVERPRREALWRRRLALAESFVPVGRRACLEVAGGGEADCLTLGRTVRVCARSFRDAEARVESSVSSERRSGCLECAEAAAEKETGVLVVRLCREVRRRRRLASGESFVPAGVEHVGKGTEESRRRRIV